MATLLFAVAGGSVLSMSVADFFELPTRVLPALFAGMVLACAVLFRTSRLQLPALSRREHAFAVILTALLMLPRLPYLLEPALGQAVNAASFDDWWHIQEMASIVHSPHFPPRSTFQPNAYLSFYYAPWLLGSAVFVLWPTATVKQGLFISSAFCTLLVVYAILFAARLLFRDKKSCRLVLAGTLVFYGGFDFMYGAAILARGLLHHGVFVLPHAEWWASVLGFGVQYSNFFTLALWVPHHAVAAVGALFAAYCIAEADTPAGGVVGGISLAFALFSSVFALMGAVPLLAYASARRARSWRAAGVAGLSALGIAAPLVWMYLARPGSGFQLFGELQGIWTQHRVLAFVSFMAVLGVEFFPLVLALVLEGPASTDQAWLGALSAGWLVSTFFIAYAGANNFAMRGSIVPAACLAWVATPGLTKVVQSKRALSVLMIPFFLGGLWEYASFSQHALIAYRNSGPLNAAALASNRAHGVAPSDEVLALAASEEYGWYLIENFRPGGKAPLDDSDTEIINTDNGYRVTMQRILGD